MTTRSQSKLNIVLGAALVALNVVLLNMLLDHELPAEDRALIFRIVRDHPEVTDLHDVRTRKAGTHRFIELHLEIDGTLSLSDAHTIADDVEAALLAAFPDTDILIHQEPAGLKDARLDHRLTER